MKRFTIASLSCIVALATPFASVRSATPVKPVTPIVKNVPGGIFMTGQDTGAPLPSPSPSGRKVPLVLPGVAVVMTGTDLGGAQPAALPGRALPIVLGAPSVPAIVMTGQDTGPAASRSTNASALPITRISPSPSPTPTRGIKP